MRESGTTRPTVVRTMSQDEIALAAEMARLRKRRDEIQNENQRRQDEAALAAETARLRGAPAAALNSMSHAAFEAGKKMEELAQAAGSDVAGKKARSGVIVVERVKALKTHTCGRPDCWFPDRRIDVGVDYVKMRSPQFGVTRLVDGRSIAQSRPFHRSCVPSEARFLLPKIGIALEATPSVERNGAYVKVDGYTILTAMTVVQEARIRALSDEDRAKFVEVMKAKQARAPLEPKKVLPTTFVEVKDGWPNSVQTLTEIAADARAEWARLNQPHYGD